MNTVDWLSCDIGGTKELGVNYFPIIMIGGAKEPQNPQHHRVVGVCNFYCRIFQERILKVDNGTSAQTALSCFLVTWLDHESSPPAFGIGNIRRFSDFSSKVQGNQYEIQKNNE